MKNTRSCPVRCASRSVRVHALDPFGEGRVDMHRQPVGVQHLGRRGGQQADSCPARSSTPARGPAVPARPAQPQPPQERASGHGRGECTTGHRRRSSVRRDPSRPPCTVEPASAGCIATSTIRRPGRRRHRPWYRVRRTLACVNMAGLAEQDGGRLGVDGQVEEPLHERVGYGGAPSFSVSKVATKDTGADR